MANCHQNRREYWKLMSTWVLGSVSSSRALRVQKVRTAKQIIPILKLHVIFELYNCTACWKSGRSDLESRTNPRNGMDFEKFIDYFESHGYPHILSLFVESWRNSLCLSMRDKTDFFAVLWGAALHLYAFFALLRYWNSNSLKVRVTSA